MSVDFANVTEVKIPQGDVTKITDSSGRILWQKVQDGYPKMFVAGYSNYTNRYHYSNLISKSNTYEKLPGLTEYSNANNPYDTLWRLTSLNLVPASYLKTLKVGDKFTAYYVNNDTEKTNWQTQAHLVTDAKWTFSNVRLVAGQVGGGMGTAIYPTSASPIITLSASSGSSVTVSALKTNFSEYINIYDNSSYGSYFSKSNYPYLAMSVELTVSSSSLGISVTDHQFLGYTTR